VKFEGVDTREQAERIKGTLFVPADKARVLDDGEYWEHDVVGCTVVTATGDDVGTVTAIVPGPAQDLLEIETAKGARLVPFVTEIVTRVDPDRREVVVDPPEGLLD
jgi:16S rRNA processing protein RimM